MKNKKNRYICLFICLGIIVLALIIYGASFFSKVIINGMKIINSPAVETSLDMDEDDDTTGTINNSTTNTEDNTNLENIVVDIQKGSSWGDEANTYTQWDIVITNKGNEITDWNLHITFEKEYDLDQNWNFITIDSTEYEITLGPVDYNTMIHKGQIGRAS